MKKVLLLSFLILFPLFSYSGENNVFDEETKKFIVLAKEAGFTRDEIAFELQDMGYEMGLSYKWDPKEEKITRCQKMAKAGILEKLENNTRCLNLIKEDKEQKISNIKRIIIENIFGLFLLFLFVLLLRVIFLKAIPKYIYIIRKAWLKAAEDAKK